MRYEITSTILDGLFKWMERDPWLELLYSVTNDHLQYYCDRHNLDSFEKLPEKIGHEWSQTVTNFIFMDFVSRENKGKNIADQYLKRRGWKEKAIPKAYIKSLRHSVTSLYEVRDVRPGVSFSASDLIQGGDPILVEDPITAKRILNGQQIAIRIVEVRGQYFTAGGFLPFEPELAEQLIDEINLLTIESDRWFRECFREANEDPGPEFVRSLALRGRLKVSAPLFSEAWLLKTVLARAIERSTPATGEMNS